MKENLGKTATDRITGFKGTITSLHHYITGCSQYGLQPKIKEDGTLPAREYFDSTRVDISEAPQVTIPDHSEEENGCDDRERP